MNTKQMVGAVLGTILKVAFTVAIIVFVYKASLLAYDYGYRIFTEPPMASAEYGKEVIVEITMGKKAFQIGELLQEKRLIRDARIFYVQNLLSEYKDTMKPGIYTLNTSMTAREMMAVMSPAEEAESTE